MQKTLFKSVAINGIGLHSGHSVRMRIAPAPKSTGIVFRRIDLDDSVNVITARYDNVSETMLNTTISNGDGASVSTIEHLMAALSGLGITNAVVEIDGPEVPVLDGSASHYVDAFERVGIVEQNAPASVYRVTRPVRVTKDDGAYAELLPDDHFHIDYAIDFDDAAIGQQSLSLAIENGVFGRELANCRTFARRADIDALQSRGFGLGGSLDNAVIVSGDRVLNSGGFRRQDECVRHKILDAVGDLALIGGPLVGRYAGYKAGHGLTNELLRKAVALNAIEQVPANAEMQLRLPGMHTAQLRG